MSDFNKFLTLLFDSNDKICYGDWYETAVMQQPDKPCAEFFSINPLSDHSDYIKDPQTNQVHRHASKGRRADLNVTKFQNFLFEMDNTPLEQQLELLNKSEFPWASITYSGGKSYHAILSLQVPLDAKPHTLEGVETYKHVWKQLATVLTARLGHPISLIDTSCQNPSRLSRMPEADRAGVKQSLVKLGKLCTTEQLQAILAEAPTIDKTVIKSKSATNSAANEDEMKLLMPVELLNRLKYPQSWAQGAAGNYPYLFKLVLWGIDSTGATKSIMLQFLEKHTFPALRRIGYPESKMYKVVDDAFNLKGGS